MANEQTKTKVVVIGGTGLIGSKVIPKLIEAGYEAVSASPENGVNTITGEGLAEVLQGAAIVVDVSNSPSFDEKPATDFFKTSAKNLLSAEAEAEVKHHVALSVVGTDILASEQGGTSGYFRAKQAQEELIKESHIPYSIVHATQFFEFLKTIADVSTEGQTVRLPPARFQPMAADEVAEGIVRVATADPQNGVVDIAGPEVLGLDEFVRVGLTAREDTRAVVTDATAGYFGIPIKATTLIPQGVAELGTTTFAKWLSVPANVNPPQRAASGSGSSR